MGWQRRMRATPGPLAPTAPGSSATLTNIEILVDGIWTDITSRAMVRDESGNVATTYGQTSEGANLDPATCTFVLNNRDGLFSPRNPSSPYYGKIGRNTQCRMY